MEILTQQNRIISGKPTSQMIFGGCELLNVIDRFEKLDSEIKQYYLLQQYQNKESLAKKNKEIQIMAKELNKLGFSNDELNAYRNIKYLNFLDGLLAKPLTKTEGYYSGVVKCREDGAIRLHEVFFDDYSFYIDGMDVSADWRKYMCSILPEVFKETYRKGLKKFIEDKQKMENENIDNLFC